MFKSVESYLKSAVKGGTLVFIGTAVSIVIWFATKVLIIQHTTEEELGIYTLAVAVISILALIAGAGLQDGSTRFISLFLNQGSKDNADSVARSAMQISMAFGFIASLGLYLFAETIAIHFFYMPELIVPLKVISSFGFFQVLSGTLVGVIRGYGNIKPRVYFISIGQPLLFLMLLTVFFALDMPFISIIHAFTLAMIIACLCIGAYGYRQAGFNPLALSDGGFRNDLLRFSFPLLGAAAMVMVLNWTDSLMLGRYATADEVGIYSVSVSLARLLTFALGAVGFVYMPIASEMHAKKQNMELKRTFQVLTKWVFAITLPLFFVLFIFPEMTITFLFGERYIVSSASLRVLSLGFMSSVFVGACNVLLIIMGRSKALMNISVIGAVLNIVLNYIFIKRLGFGVLGAASATTISYFVINLLNAWVLFRESRVHPITTSYLRPIAGTAVIGLVVYVIAKSLPLEFWMLPIYLVGFIVSYILMLILTRSVGKEDIAILDAISKRTGMPVDLFKRLIGRFMHE